LKSDRYRHLWMEEWKPGIGKRSASMMLSIVKENIARTVFPPGRTWTNLEVSDENGPKQRSRAHFSFTASIPCTRMCQTSVCQVQQHEKIEQPLPISINNNKQMTQKMIHI
jgi:hypothetical protein